MHKNEFLLWIYEVPGNRMMMFSFCGHKGQIPSATQWPSVMWQVRKAGLEAPYPAVPTPDQQALPLSDECVHSPVMHCSGRVWGGWTPTDHVGTLRATTLVSMAFSS